MMNIEVRADGARITGYVNVTEKKSRPVITPRGKVIEEIEPRAFAEAISRAGNITVTVDHDKSHIYASTDDGTVSAMHSSVALTSPSRSAISTRSMARASVSARS